MRQARNAKKILVENLKRRDPLGDIGRNGVTILKWILKKYVLDCIKLTQNKGSLDGFYEILGSIGSAYFLTNCRILFRVVSWLDLMYVNYIL